MILLSRQLSSIVLIKRKEEFISILIVKLVSKKLLLAKLKYIFLRKYDDSFFRFKKINNQYQKELKEACARVIDSGWYIQGKELESFETMFAEYCGVQYAVGVANGLDALILVLRAWKELGKLQDGDEVIVQANTYIASILAITNNNLVPVLVEPDENTFNLSSATLESILQLKLKRFYLYTFTDKSQI